MAARAADVWSLGSKNLVTSKQSGKESESCLSNYSLLQDVPSQHREQWKGRLVQNDLGKTGCQGPNQTKTLELVMRLPSKQRKPGHKNMGAMAQTGQAWCGMGGESLDPWAHRHHQLTLRHCTQELRCIPYTLSGCIRDSSERMWC